MIKTGQQGYIFQTDWTGQGQRGLRDFLLMPAIFFGAVSPGLYISSAMSGYVFGMWVALALTGVGYGLTHMLYLGRMERFWRAVSNLKTSWISRGFLFNFMFMAFGTLHAIEASGIMPTGGTAVKVLSIASAAAFAIYPGFLFMTVKAIAFWRSALEPIIFFIQGLLGGVALHIISLAIVGADNADTLVKANFALLIITFTLLMLALIMKASHDGAGRASVSYLTEGEFSVKFIWVAVVAGMIVPVLMMTYVLLTGLSFSAAPALFYVAMTLELIGIYFAKLGIIRAGAYSPMK